MRLTLYVLLLLAVAVQPALATITLTNGNATFTLTDPPVWNTATTGNGALITDTGGVDHLAQYTWGYRQTSNGVNHYMSWIDTPTKTMYGTNQIEIKYLNAGYNPERFDATFLITLTDDAQPGKARVDCDLTFKNVSASAATYNLFCLVDEDLAGTAADDTAQIINTGYVLGRYTDPTNIFGDVYGIGAAKYEVGTRSNVANHCFTGSYNLNMAAGPTTGDMQIGMQWIVTLGAGASTVIHEGFSVNQVLPEPASLSLLALGGLVGLRRRR